MCVFCGQFGQLYFRASFVLEAKYAYPEALKLVRRGMQVGPSTRQRPTHPHCLTLACVSVGLHPRFMVSMVTAANP